MTHTRPTHLLLCCVALLACSPSWSQHTELAPFDVELTDQPQQYVVDATLVSETGEALQCEQLQLWAELHWVGPAGEAAIADDDATPEPVSLEAADAVEPSAYFHQTPLLNFKPGSVTGECTGVITFSLSAEEPLDGEVVVIVRAQNWVTDPDTFPKDPTALDVDVALPPPA